MRNDHGVFKGEKVLIRGSLLGAMASMILAVILCALLALLVSTEKLQQSAVLYGIPAVLLVSSVGGAAVSNALCGGKVMLSSILSAVIFFIFLVTLTAVFFGGNYQGVSLTAGVIAAGAVSTALLSAGIGKKSKSKSMGRKYR